MNSGKARAINERVLPVCLQRLRARFDKPHDAYLLFAALGVIITGSVIGEVLYYGRSALRLRPVPDFPFFPIFFAVLAGLFALTERDQWVRIALAALSATNLLLLIFGFTQSQAFAWSTSPVLYACLGALLTVSALRVVERRLRIIPVVLFVAWIPFRYFTLSYAHTLYRQANERARATDNCQQAGGRWNAETKTCER